MRNLIGVLGVVVMGLAQHTAIAAPAAATPTSSTSAPTSCQRKQSVRVSSSSQQQGQGQGSTIAIAQWSGSTRALIADEDDAVLHSIDLNANSSASRSVTILGGTPSQLIVLADGRVAVTLRDKNRIQIFEPTADPRAPLTSLCEIDVAAEPVALATSPDGSRLLVTSEWGRALTMFDTKTMSRSFVVALPRDPRGVLVDDEGKHAFVSHVVGGTMSIVELDGSLKGVAREIALDVSKTPSTRSAALNNTKKTATKGGQGFALAKSKSAPVLASSKATTDLTMGLSEKRIYAPMAIADPGEREAPPNPSGYGSGHPGPSELPFVSVVDPKKETPIVKDLPFEDVHRTRECLLPRAATFLGERKTLLVACMGIDTLIELDASKDQPSRAEKSRWRVGAGPTGMAVDTNEQRIVVWSQFDHAATVVTLDSNNKQQQMPTRIDIGRRTAIAEEVQRGRILFHKTDDQRLSRDGRACASCHPDGREDGITWTTPMGPRQTIMLAGRVQSSTAPYSWSGVHKTIEEHVTGTFQRLGGSGMQQTDPDLKALLGYISTMKTPKHASRNDDELVTRGKAIFFGAKQHCATCHTNGNETDGQRHAVTNISADGPIDTPSLRFVRGTAPYFHDGRFASLDEMLRSSEHQMGNTKDLDTTERRALIAYLETL